VDATLLLDHVRDLLTGRPSRRAEQRRAELRAVTKTDVHRVAVEATGTSLLQVPAGRRADWAGFAPASTCSPAPVTGRRFPSPTAPDLELVSGTDGVSVVSPDGVATVRYDQCVASLRWPDGGRRLIGANGVGVSIEPTVYDVDPATIATIDAAVQQSTAVSMPPRSAENIPRPAAAPERAAAPATAAKRGKAGIILWSVIAVLLAVFALAATGGMAGDRTAADASDWVVVGILWLVALVPVWILWKQVRRRRAA
jgi:hypothetical protein